jgi:hypothetical protein
MRNNLFAEKSITWYVFIGYLVSPPTLPHHNTPYSYIGDTLMNRKRLIVLIAATLAIVVSGAVWATQARVSWTPSTLNPVSIIPGESATYTVTFLNTGPSSIETGHLQVVASGDIAPLVTVTPQLAPVIKKGESGTLVIQVKTILGTPVSLITGTLRLVPNEGGLDAHITPVLPISITVSPFFLPPDPGVAGEQTLLGIDTDENGVRDDIDRYIGFTYPASAKKRAALTQHAQAQQLYLNNASNKTKTRDNFLTQGNPALACLSSVFGIDKFLYAAKLIDIEILNTFQRVRQNAIAESQLDGMVFGKADSDCSFDPNQLAD